MPGMNPATGLPYEDEEQEEAGGAVRQQEIAASLAEPIALPAPMPEPEPASEMPPVTSLATGADLAVGQPPEIQLPPQVEGPLEMEGIRDIPIPDPVAAPPPIPPIDPAMLASLSAPVSPAAPPAPVIPSLPPTGSDGEMVPAETIEGLTSQQIAERRQQGIEDAEVAEDRARAAAAALKIREEAAIERQRLIKQGEDNFAAARARQNDAFERFRAMGEKDVWGDNSTVTKVLAGIAALVAGRPAAAFIIGAVNGLEERKKIEMAIQEKDVKRLGDDAEGVRAANREKLGDFSLQTAAGLESIAARMDSELASRGVPAAQRATNKDILEIKAKALEARRKAEIEEHKEAERKLRDTLKDNESKANIKLAEARTAELNRRPVKGAKGEGGGSPGGIPQLVKMKEEGKTDGEIATRAEELGIKPKNYLPSLANVRATERASGGGAAKAPTENQMKMAVYGRAIEDAINQIGNASALTPDIMAKYQRNQLGSEAADNSATKGTLANFGVGLGRTVGLMPKSPYDGIPPEAQLILNQIDVAKESLARIHSGGAIPTAEDRAFANLWAPKSGDSSKLIQQKLRQMKTEGDRLLALGGGATKMTEGITNADPTRSPAVNSAPVKVEDLAKLPPAAPDKKAAAQRVWNDPKAPPAARARARQYLDANP